MIRVDVRPYATAGECGAAKFSEACDFIYEQFHKKFVRCIRYARSSDTSSVSVVEKFRNLELEFGNIKRVQ